MCCRCVRAESSSGIASPVTFFPVRYVPAWFPGAEFRRKANAWAQTLREMVDQPHDFVKRQVVRRKKRVRSFRI